MYIQCTIYSLKAAENYIYNMQFVYNINYIFIQNKYTLL